MFSVGEAGFVPTAFQDGEHTIYITHKQKNRPYSVHVFRRNEQVAIFTAQTIYEALEVAQTWNGEGCPHCETQHAEELTNI